MATTDDYVALITAEHNQKPKFMAMIQAIAQPFADTQSALASLPSYFDIDSAVGVQLDAIGVRVGITRDLSAPLAVYFSFGVDGLGFGQGSWKGQYDPSSGVISADDATYRIMLKAKIGANQWNGSHSQLNAIYEQIFAGTGTTVFVRDNQDMSMSVYVVGTQPSAILAALIKGGNLNIKPSGVRIAGYYKPSVPSLPLFGFGVQNQYIAGFGTGAFAASM